MAKKILICVSTDQATVAIWRARKITDCQRFATTDEGISAFSAYLGGAGRGTIHLVVDTVEEDYRFESLPHAGRSDRAQMVARKLRQIYRTTTYFSHALLDREAGKRKDDRFLFAALTNSEILAPWLRAIESINHPVSGVYLMPMVSGWLIDRLGLKDANLLIISKNSAGLRQTFFRDRKFRISRLTPSRGAPQNADVFYADEVANTRMYLDALNITHVDDVMKVMIFDQDGSLAKLPNAIRRERPNMLCQYVAPADIESQFKIHAKELQSSPDALHLQLLGEHIPVVNLAPATVTRSYRNISLKRWVYAASGAALAVGLTWSGLNAFQAMQLGKATGELQSAEMDFERKYQQISAQFPDAPASTEALRNTVDIAQHIASSLRTPETMFSAIGRGLAGDSSIQLSRIEWHYGDEAPVLQELSRRGALSKASSHATVQVGVLDAEIRPFDGDYRAAMNTINALMTRIAAHSSVAEVTAVKLPIDVRSDSGLAGTTAGETRTQDGSFQLAVIFKPGI
ncbi:MAG: hypothetical protein ABL878_05890 [Burkholderiales bacterium]